jgi:hypothetical protein
MGERGGEREIRAASGLSFVSTASGAESWCGKRGHLKFSPGGEGDSHGYAQMTEMIPHDQCATGSVECGPFFSFLLLFFFFLYFFTFLSISLVEIFSLLPRYFRMQCKAEGKNPRNDVRVCGVCSVCVCVRERDSSAQSSVGVLVGPKCKGRKKEILLVY